MKLFRVIFPISIALGLIGCSNIQEMERDPVPVDDDYPPGILEISFDSHGDRLNALLYTANGVGPHPTVLLLHGYPGNEKNLDLAQSLRRAGWNVFFFHYRGAWASEGHFSFVHSAQDVGVALAHLREGDPAYRVDPDHITVIGHSMGGAMALVGSSVDEEVVCTVGLAAAGIETSEQQLGDEKAIAGLRAYADGLIMLNHHDGSNVMDQKLAFGDTYPVSAVSEGLDGKKLFLIAAENDQAVPLSVHEQYVETFSANTGIDLYTQIYPTDHSFSTHRIGLARDIGNWLNANCR